MRQFELYFMTFAVLSIAGWLMEVACKYVEFGRFINRGFLIGPYCPIYGVGSLLVILTLEDLADTAVVLFFMAMLVCGMLEYLTSYIMEKQFHARWWDYSDRRFNINGRVCLNTLIPFGALSMLLVYVIKPAIFSLFTKLSGTALHIICGVFAAAFIADIIISGRTIRQIRISADHTGADNTEALTAAVRAELSKKGLLLRRYVKAFPYMKLYNADILRKIKETQLRLKRDTDELRRQIRNKYSEK